MEIWSLKSEVRDWAFAIIAVSISVPMICKFSIGLFFAFGSEEKLSMSAMSKSPIKRMGSVSWHMIVDFLCENWYVAKHSSFYLS